MPKILIVEDDAEKLRRVVCCLKEVPGIDGGLIDNARDAIDAKRLMRSKHYDLLVLDIALPPSPDLPPKRDGGITLLDEVLDRDIYHKPRHIVGLTAYTDVLESAVPRFAEDLWLVILYDPSSASWIEQLQRKVRYILLAECGLPEPPSCKAHLCIVTALPSPELSAVLKLPWEWERAFIPNNGTICHRGRYVRNEEKCDVIAAAAPRMGMTAAAVLAMKMIAAFQPKYLAMAGILAGMRGECQLGDIIVADPGWDYGSGKRLLENGESVFMPAPHQINMSAFIRRKFSQMEQDQSVFDEIRRAWPGVKPTTTLSMYLGPVASGSAVLADPSIAQSVKQQHRKVIGIDLETYGVLGAVEDCAVPQPMGFSIKSVSDFADPDKNDNCREYAAFTSAMALKMFVERYL